MRSIRGFTLIELMIVVAVVAILAAIALPAYTDQVRKSRRAEARSGMSQIQLLQERWRAENPSYATADDLRTRFGAGIFTSENGKWTFEVTNVTGSTFSVGAVPAGGHTDPVCGSGFQLAVNGITTSKSPQACWQ